LTLFDIINVNKKTRPDEVRTFFQVMEVYGQNTQIQSRPVIGDQSNLLNSEGKVEVDNLKVLRMKSLDQMTQVTFTINKTIQNFNLLATYTSDETLADPKQLSRLVRSINNHLNRLHEVLDKVRLYFLAKIKTVTRSDTDPKTNKMHSLVVEPLFRDMTVPKQDQVGFLLPLTCGHNRHPNTLELMTITTHLELAGFLDPVELPPT